MMRYKLFIKTKNVIDKGGKYDCVMDCIYHHYTSTHLIVVTKDGVNEYPVDYDGGIEMLEMRENTRT